MTSTLQKYELAAFLRARREALDPTFIGLKAGARRRTPGLRREEVAQLSGVSHTWYTWLEQGRDIGVSRQVLDRLVDALRLEPSERAHLFTLAGLALPPENDMRPEVDPMLRQLIDKLSPNPAYVVNPWWDILACNDAYSAMISGLDTLAVREWNILWLTFTHEGVKALFEDWATEARQLLGQLRFHLAKYPNDPRGPEFVALLESACPAFRELWREHRVRRFKTSRKYLRHPRVGKLELDYTKLISAENDQQHLIVYMPANRATEENLKALVLPG